MYNRDLAVLQYVHKHDPRMRSAKVKETVGKRIDELVERAIELSLAENNSIHSSPSRSI